jgi:hypothetical protein
VRKVLALAAPLTYGTQLLCLFVSASALIATAAILRSIAEKGDGSLRDAAAPIAASSSRILIFSLKLFGLNLIAGALAGFLMPLVQPLKLQADMEKLFSLPLKSQLAMENSHLIANLVSHLWVLPITLCVVCLIAPVEVRLLQPPNFIPPRGQATIARIAALLGALAVTLLSLLISVLEAPLMQHLSLGTRISSSTAIEYPMWIISSLIAAAPYVLLYVAFYGIATQAVAIPPSLPIVAPDPQPAQEPAPDPA